MKRNTMAIGLLFQRDGKRVRRLTGNGHHWSDRYPLIVEAALLICVSTFVLDGEAVLLGVDGRSDFDGLHSRQLADEVQFYAFDILMSPASPTPKFPSTCGKPAGNHCRCLE